MARYCNAFLFSKSSDISVRYKATVSPHTNKRLKTLLHLWVSSAIKNNKEIWTYFKRKVNERKNKMSVLNGVRNKLDSAKLFVVVFFDDQNPNLVFRCYSDSTQRLLREREREREREDFFENKFVYIEKLNAFCEMEYTK